MPSHYDVIIVGTGFASSFFLMRHLERAPQTSRILVLERGNEDTKAWRFDLFALQRFFLQRRGRITNRQLRGVLRSDASVPESFRPARGRSSRYELRSQ
jgi:uncharacterized alpha-E superfamily protein